MVNMSKEEKQAFGLKLDKLMQNYTAEREKEIAEEAKKNKVKAKKYTLDMFLNEFDEVTGYAVELKRQQIDAYRAGKHVPRVEVLQAFCKFFNVSLEYLLVKDCNEPNRTIANVQELIKLDGMALQTLMDLGQQPQLLDVLNALLNRTGYAETMLINMRMFAYRQYKRQQEPDEDEYYEKHEMLELMSSALSWHEKLANSIIKVNKEEFSKTYKDEKAQAEWEHDHYDEVVTGYPDMTDMLEDEDHGSPTTPTKSTGKATIISKKK